MNYKYCLELALGKPLLGYQEFGDWQGTWIAKVDEDSYVVGYFGSCSGCDAFQAEFEDDYDKSDEELIPKYLEFGKRYLDSYHTKVELKRKYSKYDDWDLDAKSLSDWVLSQ